MGSVVSIADMSRLKIGSGKRIKIFGNPDRTNTPKPVGQGQRDQTISGEGQVKQSLKLQAKGLNHRPIQEANKERLGKVYGQSPNQMQRVNTNLYLSQELKEVNLTGKRTAHHSPNRDKLRSGSGHQQRGLTSGKPNKLLTDQDSQGTFDSYYNVYGARLKYLKYTDKELRNDVKSHSV